MDPITLFDSPSTHGHGFEKLPGKFPPAHFAGRGAGFQTVRHHRYADRLHVFGQHHVPSLRERPGLGRVQPGQARARRESDRVALPARGEEVLEVVEQGGGNLDIAHLFLNVAQLLAAHHLRETGQQLWAMIRDDAAAAARERLHA